MDKSREFQGSSLAVQWLGLCTPNPRSQVRSLVRELRFHMLCGAAKKKKKRDDFFKKRTPGKIKNYKHTQRKMSVENG